jgi:hypothetical protein
MLNRLTDYGEAQVVVLVNGGRAWRRIAEAAAPIIGSASGARRRRQAERSCARQGASILREHYVLTRIWTDEVAQCAVASVSESRV